MKYYSTAGLGGQVRQPLITIMIVALCASFIDCASHPPASAPEPIEEFPVLANIKKIFIADLGNEEGAGLVREKIRLRLTKSSRFRMVEVPEDADAILTGVAGVERRYTGSGGDLQTHYAGIGVLRLVDVKTKETIWIFEYKRGFAPFASASSRVADQVINKLLKDTTRADSMRSMEQPSRSEQNQ